MEDEGEKEMREEEEIGEATERGKRDLSREE